ncbi:Gfo/Idh/MocA family oxidoreductase (plasmid) [Rhizobium sophoriradicis]|uniref:Gfo/Idh/MocA family protein n=1 Tax=Rhizobium sophoriradicis TaxID=1535245 RepID=UPI00179EFE51|nr:Gfo/Idh/MocA family oxidoreductase [Rhizobium leguminosarum bv. phaseoli]
MAGNDRVGWAIMGTETIATEHMVSAIRSIGHQPLWVVSRNAHYAGTFAGDLSIPNATDDLERVWADRDVRFVYVSATRERRSFHIAAAAEAGKHILCDGPISNEREEAARLVSLCHDLKVTLAVHHIARASSVHQTMKRLIREGDIGQIHSIVVARGGAFHPSPNRRGPLANLEGDIFFDAAIEDVDLVRFLTDAEPNRATGISKPMGGAPQHLAFALAMDDGCIFQAHESFLTADIEDTVMIAGSKGSLTASGTLYGRGSGTLTRRIGGKNELIPIRDKDVHVAAIQDFVTGLHGRPTWLSTGADSVANLAAINSIIASIQTGDVIDIQQLGTA